MVEFLQPIVPGNRRPLLNVPSKRPREHLMKRPSNLLAATQTFSFPSRTFAGASGLAAGLLLALAAVVPAAEPVALDALVAETVARNPELKFYEAEIAAARGARVTAGAWANPELSSDLGRKQVRDLGGNDLGNGPIWAVSLSQTFEFPGRLSLRKAIANRQIELAELGLEQFRGALAIRVRSLGYQLLAAQQRVEAADEVAKRFQDLLAVLVQRDVAGVTPMLETRIIEASAFTLNRRASEAAIAARNAQFALNQLRGLPVSTPVEVARSTLPLNTAPPLDTLLATARERNFDVRARIAELEQQGLRVQLSRNERWPSVTVAPFVTDEKSSDRELRYGLGVTVPLPLLNGNAGSIETATARQAQAEVALAVALREVERKIAAARNAYDTFLAEIARWPTDAVQKFRDAARMGDEHYRLGALPIATYTALQTQYLDAVDALLSTQADALEARQQLELLTGLNLDDEPVATPNTADGPPPTVKPARQSPGK
jgi:outer membrane protein, heavy metal efflux system